MVINVALGFDSYLIMRHSHNGDDLGCYFCSDVVAPIDSISDRSLDQQCTVTRPGLAPIASGLAIELLISYLQRHKTNKLCNEPIPHQIRGYLYDFKNICIQPTAAYNHCAACSPQIMQEYKNKKWQFILKALNEPKYVEIVCGLNKLKDNLSDIDIEWDEESEDEEKDEWDGRDRCVLLIGPPGAGKGTQAPRLVNKFNIPYIHISQQTDIDQTAIKQINADRCKRGFILDGYPRNVQQAKVLDEALSKNKRKVTHLLQLKVPDEELKIRILGRWIHPKSGRSYHAQFNPPQEEGIDDLTGEPLIKQTDDNEESLRKNLQTFTNETLPVVQYYLNADNKQCVFQIDANSKPSQVSDKIDACFD